MKIFNSTKQLILISLAISGICLLTLVFSLKLYAEEEKVLKWVPKSCLCGDLSIGTQLTCELWFNILLTNCTSGEAGQTKHCIDRFGYECANPE